MAIAFSDSKRALEQQLSSRFDLVHLALVVFLAALLFWMIQGEIDLYRTSQSGTLKTQGATLVVQSDVDGTIQKTHLTLGNRVKKGDLLLELEDEQAQLTLTKLRNELQANRQQQDIINEQKRLTVQKYQLLTSSLENEIKQTRTQLEQAKQVLTTQKNIENSMQQLAKSSVSQMDLLKQNLEVVSAEAAKELHRMSLDNKTHQLPANERERDLALSQIDSTLTALRDDADQLQKAIEQASIEQAKYSLFAAADGEVIQLSSLAVGNKISKGQKLATISDGSQWMLQTQFKASDAVGHIAPGQKAQVVVDGFPWRQYGFLSATVNKIAKEGNNGQVEVLFKLDDNNSSQIPLTFGQPVTVEVKTAPVSPLILLLNAVDRAARGQQPQ